MAMQKWERDMRDNVRKLTPQQARDIMLAVTERTRKEGATIHHPELKAVAGYNSQSINFLTMRYLADQAKGADPK